MITPYYQDEWATIYHGDCRGILPMLDLVDLVLTDPPYGLGDKMQGGTWGVTRKQEMTWDKVAPTALVLSLLNKAPEIVIWGGNYFPLPPSRGWLSWFKPDAPPTMANFELAWTNQDRNARQLSYSISATNAERIGHPTQKPLALMRWSLSFFPKTQIVLDPFMGSGTTLRAAKDLGIKSIGIEIEEKYCQIAVERLRQESLLGVIERS